MATRPPIDWQRSTVTPTHLVPFEPPPPETGFIENLLAGRDEMLTVGNTYAESNRLRDGYDSLLDTVNAGRPAGQEFRNPASVTMYPEEEEQRIFAEIQRRRRSDPHYLPGVPDNAPAYRAQLNAQASARLAADQRVHEGATRFGQVGGLVGGLVGSMQDSANLFLLPMGGAGGETYLGRIGYAAISNALVETALQPMAVHNYETLGQDLTPWDSARSIVLAGIGGGLLHGTIEGVGQIGARAPALYDRAAEHLFNAMPEPIQRRWAGAATIDGVPLTDILHATIPPEHWTPNLRAAVHVVEREQDLREASPFEPGQAGDTAHAEALQDALDRLDREARGPARAPGPRETSPAPAPAPRRAAAVPHGDDLATIDDYMAHVGRHESGGRSNAQNDTTSAGGRFQFTDGTFRTYYRRLYGTDPGAHPPAALKYDDAIQHRLMRALTADNAALLRGGGFAVDRGNLFLLHFLGPDGMRVLRAEAGTPVDRIVAHSSIAANPTILPGRTAGDVIAWAHRAMGGRAPEMRAGASAPEVVAGAAEGDGGAAVADAEGLALSRDLEREPNAGEAVPAYESAPVLRRDLFGDEAEWHAAQDRIDREFEGRAENGALASGNGAPGRETAVGGAEGPAAEIASEAAMSPRMAFIQHMDELGAIASFVRRFPAEDVPRVENGQAMVSERAWNFFEGWRAREAGRGLAELVGFTKRAGWEARGESSEAIAFAGQPRSIQIEKEARRRFSDIVPNEAAIAAMRERAFDAAVEELPSPTPSKDVEGYMSALDRQRGMEPGRLLSLEQVKAGAIAALDAEENFWKSELARIRTEVSEEWGGQPDLELAAIALEHFDDPNGAGAKLQSESLEHDFRLDVGEDNVRAGEGEALPEGTPRREHNIPTAAAVPIATFVHDAKAKVAKGQRRRAYYRPVQDHAGFKAAKAGDEAAAIGLVSDLVTRDNLAQAAAELGGATFVPVIAIERTGHNAIPLALARHYARAAGGEIELGIVQAVRANHTGAGAAERMTSRPVFEGEIEPGRAYVIVDDVGVMGGTVAALADHIQRGGGEVKKVVLLASGADTLAPTAKQLRTIEESGLGEVARQEFGIEPGALTGSEAQWLVSFRTPERVRAYVAEKLGERGGGADGRAGSGGAGASAQGGRVEDPQAPFAAPDQHYQIDEAGPARPLAEILDDIDRQRKAADAIRGCLK